MINYQGKLLKPDGAPVTDGTYSMTFAIYEVPTGGMSMWYEVNPAVQVKKGLFSVLLGSVSNLPANIFDAPNRFFGVKVGADPEMTPRQQITTAAYAFHAGSADTVADGSVTTNALVAGCVTTDKIKAGSVTTNTLATDAVKTSNISDGAVVSQKLAANITLSGAMSAGMLTGAWDNSQNKYLRLGNVQICWGKGTWAAGDSSRACAVTFPAAFNETPSVSITTSYAQNVVRCGLMSNNSSTTAFTAFVNTDLVGAGAIAFDWIAIGRWQ